MLRFLSHRGGAAAFSLAPQVTRTLPMLPTLSIASRRAMSGGKKSKKNKKNKNKAKKKSGGGGGGGDGYGGGGGGGGGGYGGGDGYGGGGGGGGMMQRSSGGGGGGGYGRVKFWASYSDEDEPDEESVMTASSMAEVKEHVCELFGVSPGEFKQENYKIEAKQGDSWREVKSLSDLKGGDKKCGVAIRIPSLFAGDCDEEFDGQYQSGMEGDPSYPDESGGQYDGQYENQYDDDADQSMATEDEHMPLEDTLRTIFESMKENGLKPKSVLKFVKEGKTKLNLIRSEPPETISTKQYILDLANEDEDLRQAIVNRVGALGHLAEAVHYPFAEEMCSRKPEGEVPDEAMMNDPHNEAMAEQ